MLNYETSDYSIPFTMRKTTTYTTKVYYSQTNALVIVLKNSIKIYIKIAPTCFSAVTPSSGSSLSVLAEVTLLK
jgi:hypothetical protein